jgi:hypothetical protein
MKMPALLIVVCLVFGTITGCTSPSPNRTIASAPDDRLTTLADRIVENAKAYQHMDLDATDLTALNEAQMRLLFGISSFAGLEAMKFDGFADADDRFKRSLADVIDVQHFIALFRAAEQLGHSDWVMKYLKSICRNKPSAERKEVKKSKIQC